jgi:uncharacterized phiE125 gp8 family phage protein
MAYTTTAEVKQYLGISTDTDDALIDSLIDRAEGVIESYTGRVFEAQTATKYFTIDNVEGRWLYLWGYDLLTVTALLDGDADTTAFTSDQYRLEPRNETPKYAIRLKEDYDWDFYDSDSEISVTGTWGWSTTPPEAIEHACVRLTAFLYRQKDTSADIDRPFVTGDGVTIMPSSLPQDVKSILDNYKRRIA